MNLGLISVITGVFSARSHYNLTLKQEKELAGELENDSSTCDRYTFGLRWTQDRVIR